MTRLFATIKKELLVLLRDPGGLVMIFLMPLLLVVIMSLVEDAPFRDFQETRFDIGVVDLDRDSLSATLLHSLQQSKNFQLHLFATRAAAEEAMNASQVKAVILLPDSATQYLQQTVAAGVQQMFVAFDMMDSADALAPAPTVHLQLLLDPALKKNFQTTVKNQVEKQMALVQQQLMTRAFEQQLSAVAAQPPRLQSNFAEAVMVEEVFAGPANTHSFILNSVQHNVPAWAMFAMFFILFPLAGNLIKERSEGSLLRVRIITGSYRSLIAGKLMLYFAVCVLQFVFILAAGLYLMPLIGLPALVTGQHPGAVALTVAAVSLAATAYGLLVAVLFQSHHMALMFGSVSVVVLAALGGVWLPVEVMPAALQQLSQLSPLAWGLTALQSVFLKNGTVAAILPSLTRLLLFAAACFGGTLFISRRSNRL